MKTRSDQFDWSLWLVLLLACLAFAAPHIAFITLGAVWAAVIAWLAFVAWASVMPTSCMNGGLGFSLIAMMMVVNTFGFTVLALIRTLLSLIA